MLVVEALTALLYLIQNACCCKKYLNYVLVFVQMGFGRKCASDGSKIRQRRRNGKFPIRPCWWSWMFIWWQSIVDWEAPEQSISAGFFLFFCRVSDRRDPDPGWDPGLSCELNSNFLSQFFSLILITVTRFLADMFNSIIFLSWEKMKTRAENKVYFSVPVFKYFFFT